MKVQDLLDRVIRTTQGKYNERTQMFAMFNDAQNQLTDDAKMEAHATIATVIDQENYPLPADFKAPIALIDGSISNPNATYPLVNIEENRFGYALYAGNAYIKPIPTEVKMLNLYYYKYPTELLDEESVPDLDPFYHYLLASYAITQILLMPGMEYDKGTYDRAYGEWETGKMNFLRAQSRKQKRTRVNEKVVW